MEDRFGKARAEVTLSVATLPEYDPFRCPMLMYRLKLFACVLIAATPITAFGQDGSSGVSAKTRSFFVVAPLATEVRQTNFAGRDQIIYRVQADYPASSVLELIKNRLKTQGWKALKEDWLNPGIPSSHVRGWTYYEDQTTKPSTSVRAWQADWTNSSGDILTYRLEYRCPENLCASTRDLRDLRVIGIHSPAKVAQEMKKELKIQ